MSNRFWLRGAAVLLGLGVFGAGSAVQARDLTCTLRGRDHPIALHISDERTSAAFGDDPAAPTVVTDDQIRWTGPVNGRGYRTTYVFNRNTGVLIRTAPMMFDKGLSSMWPTTFDCGGRTEKVY